MWVEGSHEHASEQRFLFGRSEQHPCARVVCARGCVRACVCARVCAWCARVCACVCSRVRGPEGNGAKTQPWPFISAPRSDSRPRCPPGCSCGPQTPSYATKLAEVTQKSRFPQNRRKKLKRDRRQTTLDGGRPPEVKSFDRTQPPWTASKLLQEKGRGCVKTQ